VTLLTCLGIHDSSWVKNIQDLHVSVFFSAFKLTCFPTVSWKKERGLFVFTAKRKRL